MGLLQAMGSRKGLSTSRLLLLTCLLLMSSEVAQTQHVPAVLNLGNLPETSFSCEGKVVGGYYTDFETNCQMFHVCTLGSKGETQDIKFLCLQGTVFDQKKRVCERSEEVLCTDISGLFDVNRELFHNSNKLQLEFDGDVADNAVSASVTHRVPALDADYPADGDRFPPSDYTDDFVGRARSGGTRSEVPLFARPQRPVRAQQSAPPSQLPFSRFRSGTRRAGRPSTAAFGGTAANTAATQSVTVPIIPRMSDSNRPRVVVTNGKPFVPKLDVADSAPKITQEEDFPSLTLPETNFSCEGKVSGGHYADPETNCRMFHICVIAPDDTITDHKFLCGNSTAFEQKSRTCQVIDKVDCASSVLNYYVNNHLIIPKWLENLARRQALKGTTQSQISQGRAIAKRDGPSGGLAAVRRRS